MKIWRQGNWIYTYTNTKLSNSNKSINQMQQFHKFIT